MHILEKYHNDVIDAALIKKNKEEALKHQRSGKLSASKITWPVQWQILSLFAGQADFDAFTLRKFERGKDVEDKILSFFPDAKRQDAVEYRNVVGFIDAIMDTKDWETPCGEIPVEVKSCTGYKWKHIIKENKPQEDHVIQAGLYALATESTHFAIIYVNADDYRVRTFLFETSDVKNRIDAQIDLYEQALVKLATEKKIPVFEPKLDWQDNIKYNRFPEFSKLSESEIVELLEQKGIHI